MATWALKNLDSDDLPTLINNVETLNEALHLFGFTWENETDWSLEPAGRRDNRWYVFRATDEAEYVLTRRD